MISNIFKDGLDLNGSKVSCNSPMQITVSSLPDNTTIDFNNNLPKATVKKFVSLSFYIEGIIFKKDSGTLKLKYFPDINFTYTKESTSCSSFEIDNIDFGSIEEEINGYYEDDERKKIASRCLQYAKEWATITNYGGVSFKDCNFIEQKSLKKQCREFVKESMMNDEEMQYGSVILTIILLQIILPIIIKWIVERLFRKLFN
ncbi:MAG: hypothetical protein EBU90_03780 [Proteobacteria bacterium]|nr:hypothetical protein [Pseudomonadota bacterium]NBP14188.1 hypothetical protein [bacterium]